MGKKLLAKVVQNFRHVWGTSGNNPSRAQKFSCSYTYVHGVGQKYVCRGGQKRQIFIFTTRSKENHFFCKNIAGKMSNLKIFGGLALPSEAHAPKSFYNK